MKIRYRIGVHIGGWLFPNAATFVGYAPDEAVMEKVEKAVDEFKGKAVTIGNKYFREFAQRLFVERSK